MVGGDKPGGQLWTELICEECLGGPYGPSPFVRNGSVGPMDRAHLSGSTVKTQPNQYITAPLIPVVGGDKLGWPYGLGPFVRNVWVGSRVGPMDRARRGT